MSSKYKFSVVLASASLAVLSIAIAAPANANPNREQVKANFAQADANQDQMLDFNEFKILVNLNAQHGIGRAKTIRRRGAYGRVFGRLDTNKDGLITKEEIAALLARRR